MSTRRLLIEREVGVLPQRAPPNSEIMRTKSRVQQKATRDRVDVIQ
jgi:hypothetical protein